MIEFTKFTLKTLEVMAWCETSHAEMIAAQLAPGEAAALGRHETAHTLFKNGKCLYCREGGEILLIDDTYKGV